MLAHEGRVVQLLQGHPSIPAVFAYGRFEHFEYIALELLGPTIKELKPENAPLPLKTVLLIADQMVRAPRVSTMSLIKLTTTSLSCPPSSMFTLEV